MCVFICGGRSEGFVHVWVFSFGRLHVCLCLRREGTMEGGYKIRYLPQVSHVSI